MQTKVAKTKATYLNKSYIFYLKLIVIIFLSIGIIFRFTNLDKKPFWGDETYSAIRINGHHDLAQKKYELQNKIITRDDLLLYQKPSSTKDFSDTIKALRTSPEHPPLFYLLAKSWVVFFGDSIWTMRSLSAFISLGVFPSIYWLSRELFTIEKYPWLAEITLSLTAISPIFIRYAQEFREYALWGVAICICSASFLRAIKNNKLLDWCIYGITASFSLYTFLLSILVLLSHSIYLFALDKKSLLNKYFLALAIALLSFSPWLQLLFTEWDSTMASVSWMNNPMPMNSLIRVWIENLTHISISGIAEDNISFFGIILLSIYLGILIYSLYFCLKNTSKEVWLFILTLIAINGLAFLIPDILSEGQRSRNPQYFFPCYVGFLLAISLLIHQKLSLYKTIFSRQVTIFLISFCLFFSIHSCMTITKATTWWGLSEFEVKSAAEINKSLNPLVISDNLGMLISLAHEVNNKTDFLLLEKKKKYYLSIKDAQKQIFTYTEDDKRLRISLRNIIKQQYSLQPVYQFEENNLAVQLNELKLQQ